MTEDTYELINGLRSAPKSPSQLREELYSVLNRSFILDILPLTVDRDNDEFELVVRAHIPSGEDARVRKEN